MYIVLVIGNFYRSFVIILRSRYYAKHYYDKRLYSNMRDGYTYWANKKKPYLI